MKFSNRALYLSFCVLIMSGSFAIAEDSVVLRPGASAPPVKAQAWLNVDNGEMTPEAMKGKAILLKFWGTWCGPCVRSMPKTQKLYEDYGTKGLLVIALTREAPEVVKPFLSEHAYTLPVACDMADETVETYGVNSWPTTFLIDKHGKIVVRDHSVSEDSIRQLIGLASTSVDDPVTIAGLKLALQAGEYGAVIRRLAKLPSIDKPVQNLVGNNEGLRKYIQAKIPEYRQNAKRALMVERWMFAGRQPQNDEKFWAELNVSVVKISDKDKRIIGLEIGGEFVSRENIQEYLQNQLDICIFMRRVTSNEILKSFAIRSESMAMKQSLIDQLEQEYGK